MDLSVLKKRSAVALGGLLALALGAGTMQAGTNNLLTIAAASGTVTCSTLTGPGAAVTMVVTPKTSIGTTNTVIAVTAASTNAGLVITGAGSMNKTTGTLTFSITATPGCVGFTTAASSTVQFSSTQTVVGPVSTGTDNTQTVAATLTVVAGSSGLVGAGITVSCVRSSVPVYTAGPVQTVSVTSAVASGLPFTVTEDAALAWLTLGAPSGSAGSVAATFTATPTQPCANSGSPANGTTSPGNIILTMTGGGGTKLIPVTVIIAPPTPLNVLPTNAVLSTYVKGSGTPGYVDVQVTQNNAPAAAPFFVVDGSSMPAWLTVDSASGNAPTSPLYKNLRFSSTSVADSLPPGTYTASVHLKVSTYSDQYLPISLLINNKAPKLTMLEGNARAITWSSSSPVPTPVITVVSSDSPVPYTITTGGALKPTVAQTTGLAYNFGGQIPVTFDPLVFASTAPGSVLTGTVTFAYGSPVTTIVVTFTVTFQSPTATLSSVSPASIPSSSTTGQTYTVTLTGTGFVPSTDITLKTKVGIIAGQTGLVMTTDTNVAWTVKDTSNIILTITVPAAADSNLPFAPVAAGGNAPVMFGICNPGGGTCGTAVATASMTIGSGPIIQAITSASTYLQAAAGSNPNVAPYDMISIWGSNFCASGGTGCSSTQVMQGTPTVLQGSTADITSLRWVQALSPDLSLVPVPALPRQLTVNFYPKGQTTGSLGTAPLLFATNGQINALVPGNLFGSIASPVDVIVSFGNTTTMLKSSPYTINIVRTDPGVFTVGSDGQGDAAGLDLNYSLITSANPVGMRSTAVDSDYVHLYVTGLGAPDGISDNSSAGTSPPTFTSGTDCLTVAAYETALNAYNAALTVPLTTTWADVDGTVIQTKLFNGSHLPPCTAVTNLPTVTIGGVAGNVTYAGFVPDSIAGLYQIDVQLPKTTGAGTYTTLSGATVTTIVAPMQLPVVITANSVTSPNVVTLWIAPKLKVVAPSLNYPTNNCTAAIPSITATTCAVGVAWPTGAQSTVVASEGTPNAGNYHFAISAGVLPSGLVLDPVSGIFSGTPGANTAGSYPVTVTATDYAPKPLSGSASFTIVVSGGLVLTTTAGTPFNVNWGAANAAVSHAVVTTGGAPTYVYTFDVPAKVTVEPAGMTINASGQIGISALTPAGTYHVVITATDANGVIGILNQDIVVNLVLTHTTYVPQTYGTATTITTLGVTGGASGVPVYTLNAASTTLGFTVAGLVNLQPTTVALTGNQFSSVTVIVTDTVLANGSSTLNTVTTTLTNVPTTN